MRRFTGNPVCGTSLIHQAGSTHGSGFPELMPGAVATSLGLRVQQSEPIIHTLSQHLSSKTLLLVLDNLEQLLPAAAVTVTGW